MSRRSIFSLDRPFGDWHDRYFVSVLQHNNEELLRMGAMEKYDRLIDNLGENSQTSPHA